MNLARLRSGSGLAVDHKPKPIMSTAINKVIQRKKRRSGRGGFLLSVVMQLPPMANVEIHRRKASGGMTR